MYMPFQIRDLKNKVMLSITIAKDNQDYFGLNRKGRNNQKC